MKISDFKIAEFILRKLCKQFGCHFVDIDIEVPVHHQRLGQTLFYIVSDYIQRVDQITGTPINVNDEQRATALNTAAAMIRDYTTGQVFQEGLTGLPTMLRLNRDPFVWLILRDIICPVYRKPLSNVRVIAGSSAVIDAAKLIERETVTATFIVGKPTAMIEDEHMPFIFVNMQVENYACRAASLLCEAITAHDLSPKIVIKDLLTKTEISEKFLGLAKMALGDTDMLNDFVMSLGMLIDLEQSYMMVEASTGRVKKAQMGGGAGGAGNGNSGQRSSTSFWQLGLIEQMLEPMRGTDWTPYFTMKQFTDKLWNKVEEEKRRRGLPELSMELLLRVQSDKYKQRPDLIIQGLLADNRVW